MIYVLYGLEKYAIDEYIKELIKKHNVNELCVSSYNAKINEFNEYFMDAISMPLFGNKKVIIIEDAYYFTSEKAIDEKLLNDVESYLQNINKENIIIFKILNEKIDERKKITKLARKVGEVKDFNQKIDSASLIKTLLKDYQISYENITLIKEKLNNNIELINNEILKLIIYKNDDKVITEADINSVITDYPNIDFFTFIDNIINRNIKESLKTYYELLNLKEEPIKIIVTLANQFRLMYQAKEMLKSGFTETDIASELGEHPYRVKLAAIKAKNYSESILLDILTKLGTIDLNVKKGLIDSKSALELFIIGL